MKMQLPMFGSGSKGWIAFDAAADGTFAAVAVRTAGGKPHVVRCAQSSPTAIGFHALAELAPKVADGGLPCTLTLGRGDYQMLVIPEAPVLESEMESNIRWSLGSNIDYPAEEASVAWMRIPTDQYQSAHEKQVYAVVSHTPVLKEHAEAFRQAKLPLKAIDVRETALRNIAALAEKNVEGLALVSAGPTGVSTTFTWRGELYLDRFTAQPMDEILQGDEQRRLKFFDRVVQQVYQSIDLLSRTHPFIVLERVLVAPGPPGLDLVTPLANKLPVAVQALDLSTLFDFKSVPQLAKPEMQYRYLVALGASLRSMRKPS